MESASKKSVIVIGLAGKGKSSILNTLVSGDPNANFFRAAASRDPVTLKVSSVQAQIFGMDSPSYKFFDMPGMLGGEQTFNEYTADILKNLMNHKVSLALLVMSRNDRMDMPSRVALTAVKDLF